MVRSLASNAVRTRSFTQRGLASRRVLHSTPMELCTLGIVRALSTAFRNQPCHRRSRRWNHRLLLITWPSVRTDVYMLRLPGLLVTMRFMRSTSRVMSSATFEVSDGRRVWHLIPKQISTSPHVIEVDTVSSALLPMENRLRHLSPVITSSDFASHATARWSSRRTTRCIRSTLECLEHCFDFGFWIMGPDLFDDNPKSKIQNPKSKIQNV